MAFSVTHTFTNGSTADATQVNTNFTDVVNATSDGTEDFSINALTCAGAATFNGDVTLGNGTVDDITFTGSLASSIPIKTTYSYDIGTSTIGLRSVYLGSADSGATGIRLIAPTVSSSYTLTLPATSGSDGEAALSNGSGTLSFLEIMKPGDTFNMGLASATTSSADDSIKIQGATAALSATNPAYICTPGATAGQTKVFKITADVTIDLTGAHWGEGTNGDLTDYLLSVYAINDAGTLKWGVGSINGHRVILNADDVATATSATTIEKILVNSALGADAHASEVGWFKANFDDTGGASEDLWAVQTGTGDINLGPRPSINQYWTPTGDWTSNTTYTGYWKREGGSIRIEIKVSLFGAPNSSALTTDIPSGLTTDTNKLVDSSRQAFGVCIIRDSSPSGDYMGHMRYATSTTIGFTRDTGSGTYTTVTQASPITFASGDFLSGSYKLAITGWD